MYPTLVKNSIDDISFQHCSERLVIVAVGTFLLINTYFSKINSDTDVCVVQSVLAEIEYYCHAPELASNMRR